MQPHTHIAKFIATNEQPRFAHGTKVLVDMSQCPTKIKPLKVDDGSEIPFRIIETTAIEMLDDYDMIEKRDDYSVVAPLGARVKHAHGLFASGEQAKQIAAIAQIKELALWKRKRAGIFSLPDKWSYAMRKFSNFCNGNADDARPAFDCFLEILHEKV